MTTNLTAITLVALLVHKLGASEWEEIIVKAMASAKRPRTSMPLVCGTEMKFCVVTVLKWARDIRTVHLCCRKAVARSTELRHWTARKDLIMSDTGRVEQDAALTDTTEVQGDLAEDTEIAVEEQEINESSRRPDDNEQVGTTNQEVIAVEQVIRPVEQGMGSVQLLSCRAGCMHNQEAETETNE